MSLPGFEKVTLIGVGPFEQTEFIFPAALSPGNRANVHLFTGPNGCGKSTLLYALADIFALPTSSPSLLQERFHGPHSQVHFLFAGRAGVCANRPSSNNSHAASLYGDTVEGPGRPGMSFRCAPGPSALVDYKQERAPFNFAALAYSGQRTLRVSPLQAIKLVTANPLEDALSFDQTIRPDLFQQWVANNRTQCALARADNDLDAAATYDRSIDRITQFIQAVCNLTVSFRLDREPLRVVLLIDGKPLPLNSLPDGLKSILSWVGDLVLRLDSVPWRENKDVLEQRIFLFLDEMDIHLHPKWQRLILPAVQTLLPNSEVFASTHSPFVVGSVSDAWVYSLPESGRSVNKIEPLHSGAGKSYSVILKEVFGVEDEFDPETESLFDEFYAARELSLKSGQGLDDLLGIARQLSQRGEEALVIVSRELKQVSKRLGKDICSN